MVEGVLGRLPVDEAVEAKKEEQLIFTVDELRDHHRSADGGAVRIGVPRRIDRCAPDPVGESQIACRGGRIDRAIVVLLHKKAGAVPAIVPILLRQVAVESVRSRFGHNGNGHSARVPHRGVEVLGRDFVFRDRGRVR